MSTLPTREEIAEILRSFVHSECATPCSHAFSASDALLARLRPAWPTHLPKGALEAIAVEHERDHSDYYGLGALSRDGCNGCKMLSHAFALRADLQSKVNLLRNLLATIHRDGGHHATGHGDEKSAEIAITLVLSERENLRACAEALEEMI